jgi:hypothetical protein
MSVWGRKCDASCSRAETRDKHFQVRPSDASECERTDKLIYSMRTSFELVSNPAYDLLYL